MPGILSITSVSQIHRLLDLPPPEHPLVSLLEESNFKREIPPIPRPIPSELYAVSLKNGTECKVSYGRRSYDFDEGSLLFLAPGQSFSVDPGSGQNRMTTASGFPGWNLIFHPELIRNSFLSREMDKYTFFSYESHEALHLSEEERILLTRIVHSIKKEFSINQDRHSNGIIISHIDQLLKYILRFYGRQFLTRSSENLDTLSRFEKFLKNYFANGEEAVEMLSVKTCAGELGYSANYLSDLLKKETGKSAQEHIYFHILERAKTMLASSDKPVYLVASTLGFEYAHHFSYFFKRKTGTTPTLYRKEYGQFPVNTSDAE